MKQYDREWSALENEIKARGADSKKIIEALKELYTLYTPDVCEWLAKLYASEIGGFYYSNSARDNDTVEMNGVYYKLLPDIESTCQATGFLESAGLMHHLNYDYMQLPLKMREGIARFVISCEDEETGYFYHPQWPKSLVDSKPNRRGRDLMWAGGLAERFDFKLPYPTAYERLKSVSDSDEAKSDSKLPEYLLSKSAFLKYLNSFDWDYKAYPAGNQLAAQVGQIEAAGLINVCIDFLNDIQNKETGLWGKLGGYDAINGYLKTCSVYVCSKTLIPNADKAAIAAMDCIVSEGEIPAVTYQYNAWYNVRNIVENLRASCTDAGDKLAKEISQSLLAKAPEAIKATRDKMSAFKKHDGSFSYMPKESSATSQGMPVAIYKTNEGDVNATCISIGGVVNNLYRALDLTWFKVPVFGSDEYERFLTSLKL